MTARIGVFGGPQTDYGTPINVVHPLDNGAAATPSTTASDPGTSGAPSYQTGFVDHFDTQPAIPMPLPPVPAPFNDLLNKAPTQIQDLFKGLLSGQVQQQADSLTNKLLSGTGLLSIVRPK